MCKCRYIYIRKYMYTYIRKCMYIYIGKYTYVCVCILVHVYICVCVCVCVRMNIYTHKRTHLPSWLGLQNTLAASLQRGKTPPQQMSCM